MKLNITIETDGATVTYEGEFDNRDDDLDAAQAKQIMDRLVTSVCDAETVAYDHAAIAKAKGGAL